MSWCHHQLKIKDVRSESHVSSNATNKWPFNHKHIHNNNRKVVLSCSHSSLHSCLIILILLYLRPTATGTSRIQQYYTFKLNDYKEYTLCHDTMTRFSPTWLWLIVVKVPKSALWKWDHKLDVIPPRNNKSIIHPPGTTLCGHLIFEDWLLNNSSH